MDKFVKADDVKDLLNGLDSLPWEDEVEDMVDRLVVDDVVEVKHGKWTIAIDEADYEYGTCSICGYIEWDAFSRGDVPNYCPDCGAKMEEGKK